MEEKSKLVHLEIRVNLEKNAVILPSVILLEDVILLVAKETRIVHQVNLATFPMAIAVLEKVVILLGLDIIRLVLTKNASMFRAQEQTSVIVIPSVNPR